MPVMGPSECPFEVDKAYEEIMALLRDKYRIQKWPPETAATSGLIDYAKEREERNAKLKEALRLLFQLESWEAF